jgi:diguanylate cyclase (GGDEF)-like protein/PAS domain S-box-containing protein
MTSADPFRIVFQHNPAGLVITRQSDSIILEVNEAYCFITGFAPQEIIGHTTVSLGIWLEPAEREVFVARLIAEGRVKDHEMVIRAKDNTLRYIEVSAETTTFGGVPCLLSMIIDRTERKLLDMELARALNEQNRFREALDHVPSYVYIKDTARRYVYGNRLTLTLFGCTADEIKGSEDSRFFPPETVQQLSAVDARVLSGEHTEEEIVVPDTGAGRRIYWEVKAPIRERGEVTGIIGISTDITAHKNLEQELERQARTDFLTGLPNRSHFFTTAQKELARCRRYNEPLSIGMIDLDHFKMINDTYGHEVGDEVLKKVAEVCLQTLRESDTIGRLGGEEFAVLWTETGRDQAIEAAERLRLAIDTAKLPVEHGLPVQFTASIGVATLSPEDVNLDVILNRADQALYEAKRGGRNKIHFL